MAAASGERDSEYDDKAGTGTVESGHSESHGSGGPALSGQPRRDETLQHPRCVFQVLKRHYASYTPEMVAGNLRRAIRAVRHASPARSPRTPGANGRPPSPTPSAGPSTPQACSTSGRLHPADCCWATSAGPAAASWLCAGTPPSRAPATSRRCSTCCPATSRCRTRTHTKRCRLHRAPTRADVGYWANFDTYLVSLLKAWWGGGGDTRERLLLRLPAADHRQPQHLRDRPGPDRRHVQGLLPAGREPGSRIRQRADATQGAWPNWSGSSCATSL